MKISKNWLLVAVVTSALAFIGTRVLADDAIDIQSDPNYFATTYDGQGDQLYGGNGADVVVDAILSQPGGFGGHSYTYWEVLMGDASGAIESDFSSSSLKALGWTPTVGQNITVSATWNPYHSIPEMVTATAASELNPNAGFTWAMPGNGQVGSGQVPYAGGNGAYQTVTIPQSLANTGPNTYLPLTQTLEGYAVEVQNVTISGAGTLTTFPATNETLYLNDTAGNSMTMYYWYTSYSCAGALEGAPIPDTGTLAGQGLYDVYGFLSAYPSVSVGVTTWQDELVPTQFVGIPEPSSFMLAGIGLLGLIAVIRRRHS